jgi:hypothetical protein
MAAQSTHSAHVTKALRCLEGHPDAYDPELALSRLLAGADEGDVSCMEQLSDVFLGGRGVPADADAALEWCTAGAEAGSVECMLRLGARYATGHGMDVCDATAVKWLNKARSAAADDSDLKLRANFHLQQVFDKLQKKVQSTSAVEDVHMPPSVLQRWLALATAFGESDVTEAMFTAAAAHWNLQRRGAGAHDALRFAEKGAAAGSEACRGIVPMLRSAAAITAEEPPQGGSVPGVSVATLLQHLQSMQEGEASAMSLEELMERMGRGPTTQ